MKRIVYIILVLSMVISVFASCALLSPSTQKNENSLLTELMPGYDSFEEIEIDESYPDGVAEGWRSDGGFIFRVTAKGRGGDIEAMVAIDQDGKVINTKVVNHRETQTYSEPVFEVADGTSGCYTGMDYDTFEPCIISGATLTSNGYANLVNTALQAYRIANGLSIRIPE